MAKKPAKKPAPKSPAKSRAKPARRASPKPVAKSAAKPAAKPAAAAAPPGGSPQPALSLGKSLPEDERGVRFFDNYRIWRIFHDDGGKTVFTKDKLVELFYEDAKERKQYFVTEIAAASTPQEKAELRQKRKKEKFARQQHVTRAVNALQQVEVPIYDLDHRGRLISWENRPQKQEDTQFTEREWRYNPNQPWALKLHKLLDTYGIQGYELVGIMACRSLLTDLNGLPQLEGARTLVDTMMGLLPPEIRDEAIDLARSWRYSLSDTSKYATPAKKDALRRWYDATIQRQQVEIVHQSPGKEPRVRRLAALGTTFDREENAVYLLGSEEDADNPGKWKWPVQWKFDRVSDVKVLSFRNPPLAAIWNHPRVRRAAGPGPERLDVSSLYSDSVGSFFRYGQPTIRLELLVHAPHWIAWCIEKPFHPKQRITHETDDAGRPQLRIVVDRCDEEEILSRVLRLRDDFTVVSPPSLIKKLKATAASIAGRHA
jgi:predicted DNA-binding transcriptional regulator YafY